MVDFVKLLLQAPVIPNILANPKLEFFSPFSHGTGNVCDIKLEAKHMLMTISVIDNKYVYITGSIHKSFHGGHNYCDFTYSELSQWINHISTTLGFDLDGAILQNVEFGVNLRDPPVRPDTFIKSVIQYKSNCFEKMRNRKNKSLPGKDCTLNQFRIKLYNKGRQYSDYTEDEILRYELSIKTRDYFKSAKIGINTLDDLLVKPNLEAVGEKLISTYKDILIYDHRIEDCSLNNRERGFLNLAKYPDYWIDLKEKNFHAYKYKRRQFKNVLKKHLGETIQDKIQEAISQKWLELLSN